jgi:aminoglycoside 3-N-acetyltransferase
VGAKAEWITRDQPRSYPLGRGSPLAKLVELEGRVVLLGAPLESITLIHDAENLARVPDKPVVRYRAPVLRDGRVVWVEIEEFDTNKPIGPWNDEDYFGMIAREALSHGIGRAGKAGNAESYLFEARPLVDFAVQWLEHTFG